MVSVKGWWVITNGIKTHGEILGLRYKHGVDYNISENVVGIEFPTDNLNTP